MITRALVKTARTVGGMLLLAAGIAMLALPGPGLLTIAAGLAVLATEFEWARRWLETLKTAPGRLWKRRGH